VDVGIIASYCAPELSESEWVGNQTFTSNIVKEEMPLQSPILQNFFLDWERSESTRL
jgi:hypothetical protein